MRTAILLLVTAGKYSVLAYPDVPLADQVKQFKSYDGEGDELLHFTSPGGLKRRDLKKHTKPEKAPAPKKKSRK